MENTTSIITHVVRLVKADDLAPNSCGMSSYDLRSLVGEIDVLRSDEYVNLLGCLNGVDIPKDQLNTVIHEVMHMVIDLPVSEEGKVVAISGRYPAAITQAQLTRR